MIKYKKYIKLNPTITPNCKILDLCVLTTKIGNNIFLVYMNTGYKNELLLNTSI